MKTIKLFFVPALLAVLILIPGWLGAQSIYTPYTFTNDVTGSAAQFWSPYGVATDSSGNVYVADTGNHTIRKIIPSGAVTTLAGLAGNLGSDDGTGSAARFKAPTGVATDSSGNVYVADSNNHTIRKITSAGEVTTLAGLAGSLGSADGTGNAARFNFPNGVGTDSSGNVYVADTESHTIRKITPAGVVTTLAGLAGSRGSADGTGSAARFYTPYSVATDSSGNVYAADYGNSMIRKITPSGVVTTFAGLAGYQNGGSADGTGSQAQFLYPSGVATDSLGNVYVADTYNETIRKITPGGVVTTLAGLAGSTGSDNGTGSAARFFYPSGVATDSLGNVYVADSGNATIRKGFLPPQLTSFTTTGALIGNRAGHTATLLPNGQVLVVGGFNGSVRLTTSELYNPATGVWTATGALATGRTTQTATLLTNGKVLVTGGHVSAAGSTATCELYDPATGVWTATGTMGTARGNHTATPLLNGNVLVVGGFNRNTSSAVSTAELYDPATGTWTPTGSLATARDYHTATLLIGGIVLVTGGAPDAPGYSPFWSAEVYDPTTGTWTTIGSMISARQAHTATLLPDGRVLVAGGFNAGYFISSAEIYDPAARTWTGTGSLGTTRGVHTANLLPDGKVLAAGGNHNSPAAPTIVASSSAELYDPVTATWTATGSLNASRSTHTATLLPSGKVLVEAGYYVNGNVQLFSSELYDSAAGPITLVNPVKLPGGAFQFAFIGAPNGTNTVLATTNPALPLANWMVLGVVPEFSSGLFIFSDPQAANRPQRFYRVLK